MLASEKAGRAARSKDDGGWSAMRRRAAPRMRPAAMASTPAAASLKMTGRYSAPALDPNGMAPADTPTTMPAPRRATPTAARIGPGGVARGPAAGTTASERVAEPSGASRRAMSVGSGALSTKAGSFGRDRIRYGGARGRL